MPPVQLEPVDLSRKQDNRKLVRTNLAPSTPHKRNPNESKRTYTFQVKIWTPKIARVLRSTYHTDDAYSPSDIKQYYSVSIQESNLFLHFCGLNSIA